MTPKRSRLTVTALFALPLVLAACAHEAVPLVDAAPPAPPRPISPAPAYGALVMPPRDADGAWATPNRNLTDADATWHLRAALNVAALRCTGAEADAIRATYNAMLKTQKKAIDKSYAAIRARYKAADAKGWQTAFDIDSTKLYNYFAQPAVKPAFCAAAAEIAAQLPAIKPAGFGAFAAITLPALDRQFTDFYDSYSQWATTAAEWDAKYGTAQASAQPVVTAGLN